MISIDKGVEKTPKLDNRVKKKKLINVIFLCAICISMEFQSQLEKS